MARADSHLIAEKRGVQRMSSQGSQKLREQEPPGLPSFPRETSSQKKQLIQKHGLEGDVYSHPGLHG